MSIGDDEATLVCDLMERMKEFQAKYPDPEALLKGYALGMVSLFVSFSTELHLLPDQIEEMMSTTFQNIRRNTLNLLRQADQGDE
jgi:hypothetical protein